MSDFSHEGPDGQDQRGPALSLKFYLSARLSRAPEMRGYAKAIEAMGHAVVSTWIHTEHTEETDESTWPALWARDFADLSGADSVIFYAETEAVGRRRGGRFVEFGWAFMLRKLILVVGPLENAMQACPGCIYGLRDTKDAVRQAEHCLPVLGKVVQSHPANYYRARVRGA